MSFDLVLMVVVLAGIGLSTAYIRAEYMSWREDGAAERRRELALSELHAARLSRDANLHPSVVEFRGPGAEYHANGAQAASNDSRSSYASEERRQQPRQQATQ